MEEFSELKSARLLSIYARLLNGRVLNKQELAQEFGVTARSIQRDLESLRSFCPTKCWGRTWSMTAQQEAIVSQKRSRKG